MMFVIPPFLITETSRSSANAHLWVILLSSSLTSQDHSTAIETEVEVKKVGFQHTLRSAADGIHSQPQMLQYTKGFMTNFAVKPRSLRGVLLSTQNDFECSEVAKVLEEEARRSV